MTDSIELIAEHQALFRAANDRVHSWPESAGSRVPVIFYCECGDLDCRTHLRLTSAEYEAVRADPARFLVAPGHVIPDAERVVEEHDRYVVVQKHDRLRSIVERTDPRGRGRSDGEPAGFTTRARPTF